MAGGRKWIANEVSGFARGWGLGGSYRNIFKPSFSIVGMRDCDEPVGRGEVRREDLVEAIADLTDYDENVVFGVDEVRDRLGYPSLRDKKQDDRRVVRDGKSYFEIGYGHNKAVRDLAQLEEEGLLVSVGRGYRINAEKFSKALADYDEMGLDEDRALTDKMAGEVGL